MFGNLWEGQSELGWTETAYSLPQSLIQRQLSFNAKDIKRWEDIICYNKTHYLLSLKGGYLDSKEGRKKYRDNMYKMISRYRKDIKALAELQVVLKGLLKQ